MTVRIVADSACDLPRCLAASLDITTVPVYVSYGEGETFRDGIDISASQILERLARPEYPRFSLPSPGDFLTTYRRLADGDSGAIISIHMTARLSGTYNAAVLASRMCPELDVTVVDSSSGSMGVGWVVISAARAALSGCDRDQVLAAVRDSIERTAAFYLVPDLTYLHRTGRLGLVQAWLGRGLSLAPVITVRDGVAFPYRLYKGRARGLKGLVSAAVDRFGAGAAVRAAAVHVDAEDDARSVIRQARLRLHLTEEIVAHAGASVTGALGPGTVGLCILGEPASA